MEPRVPLFSTGIPDLDELLGGGIPANTLNIIAGEPTSTWSSISTLLTGAT